MIITYIRTLVALILGVSAVFIALIIWQSFQQEKISNQSTGYHFASMHHVDEISKEVLQIRNQIIAGENIVFTKNKNVRILEKPHKINHSLYLIAHNFKQLAKIQNKYNYKEFTSLLEQLNKKLHIVDDREIFYEFLVNNDRRTILTGIDSILLTLEQLGRLHEIANNNLFEKQHKSSNDDLKILVAGSFLVLLFITLITNKTQKLVKNILKRQKDTEEELFNQKEQVQITLESIGDAVISTDRRGMITYLNPVAEEITQWECKDAVGLQLNKVFNIANEETDEPANDLLKIVLHDGVTVGLASHTILISRDGSKQAIEDSAAPIRDREGNIQGIVVVFHDVTHARKMAQEMTWQASHDALTHLANRHKFESDLSTLISSLQDDGQHNAFLYIDLDQFKIINDTCGHIAGDELLKQASVLLKSLVRDMDTVARLGGDEFGILLPSCPEEKAISIAKKICEDLHEFRFIWEEKVFSIGCSIGLVPITTTFKIISDVTRAADIACYAAKDAGGNRVHVYQVDDEVLSHRQGQMEWVARINTALEKDRFVLYKQPILSLTSRNESKQRFEVLLRMLDDNGELISPMSFIPAAERYNLMSGIDHWVVSHAFQEISKLNDFDMDFFSLNISGQTLGDEGFLDFVIEEMEKHGIPHNKVCFEITETAAITNFTQALQFISILKDKGCKFALDDFGSGLSSFGYLKNLPVNYLKIDGSFVQDMLNNPIDQAMVESINSIGHLMNIETIAEFVENSETEERLRLLGVDYGQGYGLAKPVPLS